MILTGGVRIVVAVLGLAAWAVGEEARAGNVLLPVPMDRPVRVQAAAKAGTPWELPLRVEEKWGQGGLRYVTGGVPLLPGQALDPAQLRLATKDRDGKLTALPAQFRALARWWRADNSIRWVLADFATDVGDSETKTFFLTNADLPPAPAQPLAVKETDDSIEITTGPARFIVGKKKFAFLQNAFLDENGDGQFAPGEDALATTAECGGVIEDTLGNKYYTSAETKSVEVVESGPMRVQLRARGIHKDPSGKGYSKGLYQYDVFLNFYAGSTDVKADYVIANNFPVSSGSPTFEDASLVMKLAGGANGFRVYGEAPLDGSLAAGESVYLLQDSNGAETWERALGQMGTPGTATFRGYRILKRAAGKEEILTGGSHARGLSHLYGEQRGLIAHLPYFWEQFPKGVELSADGTFRIAFFPKEYKVPHYLEDASGKGHEIVLHFYAKNQKNRYAADPAQRTWPHVFADNWDYPVFPLPALEHKGACGALADVGPYTPPTSGFSPWPMEIHYRRMLMTDPYWGNGFGWQVFGERWKSHGGHSSRGARQPIEEDAFLYRYYVTEHREWFVYGDNRSRNFRDVRSYRIEDQNPFGFSGWGEFSKANRSEDYSNRPQPKDEEYQKFSQGLWNRSTWWLPNPAHQTLDLLYDRYLLFGDVRALENMRIVAAHAGNWIGDRKPYVHRETGWSFRAIDRYWELTGDKEADQLLRKAIRNYEALIGKAPLFCAGEVKDGGVNWWFTQVFSRGVAMTALHTGDAKALELCKTLAVDKERKADYFCTLFGVLWHLTGDEKYREALLKKTGGDGHKLLVVLGGGDFPATAHWLLQQPPAGKGK